MFSPTDLSVFIPYVFPNVTKDRIAAAFESNSLGLVDRIDLVSKTDANGKFYNYAFVHFSHWFDNDHAARFLERLEDTTKQARLVYDDPWYWIVLPNTGKTVVSGSRKPCIDLTTPANVELVDTDYVSKLESEIAKLYLENLELKDIIFELDNAELFARTRASVVGEE
jgi:hypothetical protein